MDTASHCLSRAELCALLRTANPPLVLDVRRPAPFARSDHMVATALHCAPDDVAEFAASQPPRQVVVYCVFGHEVGHAAARTLREAGWDARFLEGGFEGGEEGVDAASDVARWRAVPLPLVPKELGP